MPLSIPPELKKIQPFIRRAEELDKDSTSAESRLVAYYCRQYAVHLGIPLASSSAAAKTCLGELLGSLEVEKPAMDNFTRDEAKFLCQSFAEKVFLKADEADRLGAANKGTAKTFYAAASFIQILDQFVDEGSEESEEIKKKVDYSKWKSTEILKALKEGRQPTPGGYGEEEAALKEDLEVPENTTSTTPSDEPGQIISPTTSKGDYDDHNSNFGINNNNKDEMMGLPPPMPRAMSSLCTKSISLLLKRAFLCRKTESIENFFEFIHFSWALISIALVLE